MANKRLDLVEKWIASGEIETKLALMQSMSMQGKSLEKIADRFGIKERQLCYLKKKHNAVSAALKNGRENVVALGQNKLIDLVKEGNLGAIIYSLKIYGGEFFNDNKLIYELKKQELELKKQSLGLGISNVELINDSMLTLAQILRQPQPLHKINTESDGGEN